MPESSITEQKWDKIMKPVIGPVLQKSSTISRVSRDLVLSSRRHQGYGAYHTYYLQNILQLGIVASETWNEMSMGLKIQATTEKLRREARTLGELSEILQVIL